MVSLQFFYNPALPSDKDWVRYLVGDTREDRAELDDREIEALLLDEAEPEGSGDEEPTAEQWRSYRYLVASRAATAIAAKHAGDTDIRFDNQSINLSGKFLHYTQLATKLQAKAHATTPLKVIRV